MQWLEQSRTSNTHSWTLNGNEQIASVSFTPDSKSFRLLYTSQRWFFLEYSGLLQQKIVLKSEYGVTVGEIQPQRYGQQGTIVVNGLKCYYGESGEGVAIFDKSKSLFMNVEIEKLHELDKFELAALLFSFAWIFPAVMTESPDPSHLQEQV